MSVFDVEYLNHLENFTYAYLLPFGIKLITALLVFYLGRAGSRLLIRVLDRFAERSKIEKSLRKFLLDLVYGVLMAIVVVASLERVGIKTTAAIAILGALGLAIGLALQGSLGNFASGVMIILFKPYRVGDVIAAAGHTGKVECIKVFNTELRTPDNRTLLVPNGLITAGSIENMTSNATRRVDIVFGIGYGDDIQKARGMIREILDADPRVLEDPPYQIVVAELGESSVNLAVRPWVKTEDYWPVLFDLLERLKEAADRNGITIPFPQRDVHLVHDGVAVKAA